jgi:hypothetical protein
MGKHVYAPLKRGDRVICIHYKDRPICAVRSIVKEDKFEEIWVKDKKHWDEWWGPRKWFRKIPKRSAV